MGIPTCRREYMSSRDVDHARHPLPDTPAGSRGGGGGSGSAALPPVPPGFVANPDVQEASMAQTRVVMAEIVSPAESNGLDICNVSQSERSCACLYVEAAARCRRRGPADPASNGA